jgi:hypothetical protein
MSVGSVGTFCPRSIFDRIRIRVRIRIRIRVRVQIPDREQGIC